MKFPETESTDLFEAAALGETSWLTALSDLAARTGSARGQLIGIGGPAAIPFNWINDMPSQAIEEFVAINGGSPEVNPRVAASGLAGVMQVVGDREYAAIPTSGARDIYADFSARWDIPFGCQTTLIHGSNRLVGLAVLRSGADGATGDDQMAAFARISLRARKAVRLGMALEGQGALLLAGTLENLNVAAILCDASGRVQAITPLAAALLGPDAGLSIHDGQVTARSESNQTRVTELLASLLRGGNTAGDPVILEPENPMDDAILVAGHTLARHEWAFGFQPRIVLTLRLCGPGAAARSLRERFDLSPAAASEAACLTLSPRQRDCLQLLAEGLRPDAIADQLALARVTVDMHLSQARRKLGCKTLTETVARAMLFQQISVG